MPSYPGQNAQIWPGGVKKGSHFRTLFWAQNDPNMAIYSHLTHSGGTKMGSDLDPFWDPLFDPF